MEVQTNPPELEVAVVTEPHATEQVPETVMCETIHTPTEVDGEHAEQQINVREAEIAAILQNETAMAGTEEDTHEPVQVTYNEDTKPLTSVPEQQPHDKYDLWEARHSEADNAEEIVESFAQPINGAVVEPIADRSEYTEPIELPQVVIDMGEMAEPETQILEPEVASIPVETAWEEMLYKPPAELHEDFVSILEHRSEQLRPEEDSAAEYRLDGQFESEVQPVAPIITAITERLAMLDEEEKETSAQALRDVVGALHGLQVLEAQHADQERVAHMEQQLTELCVRWLESLDIEYTEQDIKTFVQVLRGNVVTAEIIAENGITIKDPGTHEEKYFARMAAATISDVEHTIQAVLGTLVLSAVGVAGGSTHK